MGRRQNSSQYRGFRTAGIRLNEELLPHLVSHRTERLADIVWAVHEFDKAHIVALTEKGVIPRADGVAMLQELRKMEAEGVEKVRSTVQGGVHSGEQFLIRRLGEDVGGRMHLARSSGDLDEVGRRMAVRRHMIEVMSGLLSLRRTLLRRADEHAETIMPGYTQGQHAQPTTLGHWLSMWALVMERNFERFRSLLTRVNVCPAGAAIMTGSEFALDREWVALLLGFDGAIPHTMDAIMSHDIDLEIASVLAILGSDFGRLGEDMMLYTSSEFAMMDVPDRYCGTSSIMMQKKNPYAPQEMKALAAEAIGGAMTAFYVEKDATGVAILERRRTERAFWSVFGMAKQRIRDADEIIGALLIDKERMELLSSSHWGQAADVASALVREKGLPWRTAHQIVGILVRLARERRIKPLDTTVELLNEAAIEYMDKPVGLSAQALREALNPADCVRRRTLWGGPAPSSMRQQLSTFVARLEGDATYCKSLEEKVKNGQRQLEQAIDRLIG